MAAPRCPEQSPVYCDKDTLSRGHVGRLINVLIGFDEQFKNSVSPKEYFQNNISLIAKSQVPMAFKLEQAKRLMDDIKMPEEERQLWLEAF